jgi:magnesium-transporting ATPase (P-type)
VVGLEMLRRRRALIDVRMNPGDHAVTAHAIGECSA